MNGNFQRVPSFLGSPRKHDFFYCHFFGFCLSCAIKSITTKRSRFDGWWDSDHFFKHFLNIFSLLSTDICNAKKDTWNRSCVRYRFVILDRDWLGKHDIPINRFSYSPRLAFSPLRSPGILVNDRTPLEQPNNRCVFSFPKRKHAEHGLDRNQLPFFLSLLTHFIACADKFRLTFPSVCCCWPFSHAKSLTIMTSFFPVMDDYFFPLSFDILFFLLMIETHL